MKNIFTLIASSMTLFNVHCQTIKDTIFNEIYIIKTENIIKNDNALFIDIAIETQKAPVVLMSSDRNVSAKLFCDRRIFLPEQNKFILITPDWEFIKEIREIEKREGIHIKAEKHKFYYIERNITDCKIDSLSRSIHDVRNPIVLNYKDISSKKDTRKLLINSDNINGRSKLTYSQNDSISDVVKTQTNLQNFECLQESINISGRFFDKQTNEIITDAIVIIRSKKIVKEINSNGYFYLTLPKNLELEFPLLISFQSAGYKKEELYINSLNDLLNLQNQIKVILEYDDYEVGLILKAKTSIWFKIKKWFRKKKK